MLKAAFALLCACSLAAQDGADINPTAGPPHQAYQVRPFYVGSNISYICKARSFSEGRLNTLVAISAQTAANPVVFTSTAHGLDPNSRPKVKISGYTGGWTPVNGTWTATILSANTFSIALDGTAFNGFPGPAPVFSTTAPRYGVAEWSVQVFSYDASSNLVGQYWLTGNTSLSSKCSDGALAAAANVQ